MLAKKYRSTVVSIENPYKGIYTLEFAPEKGKYKFLPGQFLHIAMDEDYDGVGQWPESRCFTMQSSPGEKTLKVTYAVKGEFTREMESNLKEGAEVWLKLPYGDLFQQDHNKEKTVFIAGGTGITPYLSLFNHVSFQDYTNPVIYLGFRSENYNIYEKEISNRYNSGSTVHFIYQDTEGILDINKIFEENGPSVSYFISGPPAMINTFKQKLIEKGVPDVSLLSDDWE